MKIENKISKSIVEYLAALAVADKFPQDVSQLNQDDLALIVKAHTEQMASALRAFRADARTVISGEYQLQYNKGDDSFFEAQIDLVNLVLGE